MPNRKGTNISVSHMKIDEVHLLIGMNIQHSSFLEFLSVLNSQYIRNNITKYKLLNQIYGT